MKKKISLPLLLMFISSCANVANSENSIIKDSGISGFSPTETSTTAPTDTTTIKPTDTNSSTDSSTDVEFEGYHELAEGLYVNYLPGVYEEEIDVKFKLKNTNSKLSYSLDGSIPTKEYDEPIKIKRLQSNNLKDYPLTTSVDAILAWDNGGKCVSTRYINNVQNPGNYTTYDRQNVITIKYVDQDGNELNRTLTYLNEEFSIPVVSLSMPYEKWFGEKEGFYNKIREEIEHRVNMEYFDSEYNEYFYINSQIKLGGNWTLGYPLRTLNLNFNKDENGEKQKLPATHLFKDRTTRDGSEELTSFKRFRLHSGGNAFEEWTGFNDAILQNMMEDSYASTTGYRPCIVYCNGEYWGLEYIREHYKDVYYETNYGVDKDSVALYEYNGNFIFEDGDDSDYNSYMSNLNIFLNTKDFSKNETYEEFINKYIDINSFIDVFIAELYAGNWDFVGNNNNLKVWRTTSIDPSNPYADGKMHFVLHDVDFAFTELNRNFLDKNDANSYSKFPILKKLLQNEKFKQDFYNRAVELMKTNFSLENGAKILYEMMTEVSDYKEDAMLRWGNHDGYDRWVSNINNTYEFFKNREKNFLTQLKSTLDTY